ncbi:MAG: glutaredoxin domain-containing protein [Salinivirgaceae bacterium]
MISIDTLENIPTQTNEYFVLVYRSESDQSECALRSVEQASEKVGVTVYTADVNKTRSVHQELRVGSVPTFVKVVNGVPVNHVKGCQSAGYYQTIMEGKSFAAAQAGGGSGPSVVMYTTPTCSFCNSLKAYLNENQVHFSEIDVSKDHAAANEMVQRSGQQGVPQTVINNQVVIGFDRAKINQLLNINN